MIDYIMSKQDKEVDTIIFKIYKSGIDEKLKEKFRAEEIRILNEKEDSETDYYDYKPIYSKLCEEYWEKEFDILNKEFKNYLKSQNDYKCYEDEKIDFINKIDYEDNKYSLIYDYEISEDETIVICFHLYRAEKNDAKHEYDEFLEKFKIEIKNFWIKKTKDIENANENCYWAEDTQSQRLCFKAYPIINSIENRLRFFIDKVMIYNYGLRWSDIIDEESSIMKKYSQRKIGYKKDINSFANINNFLMSLDSEDLIKIMSYKKSDIIDCKKLDLIISGIKEVKIENNQNLEDDILELKSMAFEYKYDIDVWEKCFKSLFDYESQEYDYIYIQSKFLDEWTALCKYRNHIAHNKFIDYKLYNQIVNLSNKVDVEIDEAEKHLDERVRSNFTSEIEVNDYMGGMSDYIILNYHNKVRREKVIYEEIVNFVKYIKEEIQDISSRLLINLDNSVKFIECYKSDCEPFNSYIKDQKNGLECFVKSIIENDSIEIINIKDKFHTKFVTVKIKKCRGRSLTNYLVNVNFNNTKESEIIIGHDGYNFIADGLPEYDARLTGEWRNVFFYEVRGKLLNTFISNV